MEDIKTGVAILVLMIGAASLCVALTRPAHVGAAEVAVNQVGHNPLHEADAQNNARPQTDTIEGCEAAGRVPYQPWLPDNTMLFCLPVSSVHAGEAGTTYTLNP
jgi:hypothetical protein